MGRIPSTERRALSMPVAIAAVLASALVLGGCATASDSAAGSVRASISEASSLAASKAAGAVEDASAEPHIEGTSAPVYGEFVLDNLYSSIEFGDIHYNIYVPPDYDSEKSYALFVTLPGSDGLYAEGVGANLELEEFAFAAQGYISDMIVVAPQPDDWGQWAADQTIALIDDLLTVYSIDPARIYIEGYSYGGETMSYILEKRPGMFARALHVSSQWDGDLYPVAEARLPVYFFIGEEDSYYGSQPAREAYERLVAIYREQGLSEEEIAELAVFDMRGSEYFDIFGVADQHAVGVLVAEDPEVMGWLLGRAVEKPADRPAS